MVEFDLNKFEGSSTLLKMFFITSLESLNVNLKSYFRRCISNNT